MSSFEWVSAALGLLGLALNTVLLVMVYRQLNGLGNQIEIGRAQNEAGLSAVEMDHRRRRSQATIDFYAMTVEKRSALGDILPYERDAPAIHEFTERLGQEYNDDVRSLVQYLDLLELLATGVRTDVFDIEVIEGVESGLLQDLAKNYMPWIEARRAHLGSATVYSELLMLAKELERRYGAYSSRSAT